MPTPTCQRCGGTGVIETPAGTDASGITLLSPQPCSCAAPSWLDAHMAALPPDQAERQWMDLSEMREDEDDR